MIKVFINGISGKMGSEVAKLVKQKANMHLLGGYDKLVLNKIPYPVYNNFDDIFEKPDVIIDFSVPEATMAALEFAIDRKIPIVIATTGFAKEQEDKILKASSKIPIFKSANMSYETTLMKKIVAELSQNLKDAEIEIIETHHNEKKDSPSGTALMLADAIQNVNNNKYHYVFNRMQKSQKREKNEIGFSSIRGGNIVGEHSVIFFNENETLEIKHTAYSRSIFAEGSIKVAEFLVKQPIGYYDSLN